MQRSLRIIGVCFLVATITGCATPSALPTGYRVPMLLQSALPAAQQAILKYADEHDGQLPETTIGEQFAMRAITTRTLANEELDAAGTPVTVSESIDGIAYLYRPAQDTFILTVCGRVVRSAQGAPTPMCAWFCFQGRYSSKGAVIDDRTTYLENTELFIDAMRSTTHTAAWNSSAWAITRCYASVIASNGQKSADGMVDHFIKEAIATGRARVPTGMPPRQAAFGGVGSKTTSTPPATK